jgi:hypothetical protein
VSFDDYHPTITPSGPIYLACVLDAKRPLLVDHFVRHYVHLGVPKSQFLFVLNVAAADAPNAVAVVVSALRRHQISFLRWTGTFTPGVKLLHLLHLVSARARATDWIVWADLDEFHHFPMPLDKFTADIDRNGSNVVQGNLVDRLTMSGALVAVKAGVNIGTQFPLQCRITHMLLNGDTRKTVLTRGSIYVDAGHHAVPPRAYFEERGMGHLLPPWVYQANARIAKLHVFVAHYKWTLGVQSYAKERAQNFQELGIGWWHESHRLATVKDISLKKYC